MTLEFTSVGGMKRALTHKCILKGVDAFTVKNGMDKHILTADEVYRFIPKSTFARKLRAHSTLSVEEGDRISRLVRVKAYAAQVFEDEEMAETWLHEENPALDKQVPIDLLLTDDGARRVEAVLRRIDYGDYS